MKRSEREALLDGLTEIDRLVDELGLDSPVQQRTTELYRRTVSTDDLLAGRGVNQIVAACIVLASRESNDVREADEVAEHCEDYIRAKTIHRCMNSIRKELDLGFMLADPHKYVETIEDKLNPPEELVEQAHSVVAFVLQDGVASGKKAAAVAASSFYLVGVLDERNGSHGYFTQREIADAAGVTEVTIRNSYRDFAKVVTETPDNGLDIPVNS